MKPNSFKYSVLAVGVVAAMGITTANSATTSGATSNGAAPINNVATASYSVGTVAQPTVTSNTVTVNVSETANFSLVAIDGTNALDDKNENITTTPGNGATFNHVLTNNGNVADTYTINTTGDNDNTITTATPDYALGTASTNGITFTILQANGSALTTAQIAALAGQAQTGTISNGGKIKLQPGLKADLSYTVTTPNTRLGGDIAVGTLTATSTFITAATTTPKVPTLVNENQIIVRLPTFKIAKTATSNVDLSVANPQIDYSITVTNVDTAYSALADNFVIRDVLPAGMTLTGNVTASGLKVTSTSKDADGRQIIDIAVPSLAVGANQVVSFKVNVDKANYTTAGASAINNVAVYDKFVGTVGTLPVIPADTDYDILDSTVTTNDKTRVPTSADAAGGVGEDTAGVTSFSNRAIVLNNETTREIAPTSGTAGQVTHTTNIVNNGRDTEGTTANPLTFTITDGGVNGAVAPVAGPVTVTYTPPNNGTVVTTTLQPTVSGGNSYLINSTTLPSGIAPGGTLAINYKVTSTAAVIPSSENTIVTLTAAGNGAPTILPVTDKTNVKGLTLEKFQALDTTCAGTVADASFSKDAIANASPDQCIIYRINATNTSSAIQTSTPAAASGFNITGLTISDLLSNFSAGADLVAGSPASTATTGSTIGTAATANTTAVTTTASTLAPQGVASLTFKVKIKNAR